MESWLIPLFSALVGGFLSALGAWFSIGRQIKHGQQSVDQASVELFRFLISEQQRELMALETYRSANGGAVAIIDIDRMLANYEIFARNKEWIVRIRDELVRTRIMDLITEIQIWATVVRGQWLQLGENRSVLAGEADQASRVIAIANADRIETQLNAMFADLPRLKHICSECHASLRPNRRGRHA